VEICGVLVGTWARDGDGPYVHVRECIRGEAAANKFAEVTFTHETWARINQQMDTRFSQWSIVGWYHSHPGFGVFLSDRDCFIQEHFFSGPGQIAHVVDPLRKSEGIFFWREGKPLLAPHFWVGDRIQAGTPAAEESAASRQKVEPSGPVSQPETPSAAVPSSWAGLALHGILYVMVFLLGYLVAGKLTDIERLRIEQGALARSLVYFKIRPGLRGELTQVDADLQAAERAARTLSQEHLKLLSDPQEPQARWTDVLQKLDLASRRIAQLGAIYSLSPQEEAVVLSLLEPASGRTEAKTGTKDEKSVETKPEEATKQKREEKKQ
jgi:proteasome lid subunit RPN8/RPN11